MHEKSFYKDDERVNDPIGVENSFAIVLFKGHCRLSHSSSETIDN